MHRNRNTHSRSHYRKRKFPATLRKGALRDAAAETATTTQEGLPTAPAYFFGRTEFCEELVKTLSNTPTQPMALRGHPGQGKTTIARTLLHESIIVKKFDQRRWFVRCDALRSRIDLAAGIAAAIGLPPTPYAEERVFSELEQGAALLVLDNFETPWEQDRAEIEALLENLASRCRSHELALVITMRGLELPHGVAWNSLGKVEQLDRAASLQLFLAIAGSHLRDDPRLPGLLAETDDLALAVELLAHQAQGQGDLEDLHYRWEAEKSNLLRRGTASQPATNLALSIDLSVCSPRMTEPAKQLLALLSDLPAGIERQAIRELFGHEGTRGSAVLRQLSLAVEDGSSRVRLLVPVRLHVRENYFHYVDLNSMTKISKYLINLALQEGQRIFSEQGAKARMKILNELPNINYVIRKNLNAHQLDLAFMFIECCVNFLATSEIDINQLINDIYQSAINVKNWKIMANIDYIRGQRAMIQSLLESALNYFEIARQYFQNSKPRVASLEAECISSLADIYTMKGEYELALKQNRIALQEFQRLGKLNSQGHCIRRIAHIARLRGQMQNAETEYKRALQLHQRSGQLLGQAHCLHGLGIIQRLESEEKLAIEYFSGALDIYIQTGDLHGQAYTIGELAEIDRESGHLKKAELHYDKAASIYRKLANRRGLASCTRGGIFVCIARGQLAKAETLLRIMEVEIPQLESPKEEVYYNMSWTDLFLSRGDVNNAQKHIEQAISIMSCTNEDLFDPLAKSICANRMGFISMERMELDLAEVYFKQQDSLLKSFNLSKRTDIQIGLARLHFLRKQYDIAEREYTEIMKIYSDRDKLYYRALCTFGLAEIAMNRNRHFESEQLFHQAEAYFKEVEHFQQMWISRMKRAQISIYRGQIQSIEPELSKILEYFVDIGDMLNAAHIYTDLAFLARVDGRISVSIDYYKFAIDKYQKCGLSHKLLECETAMKEIQPSHL